MDEEKLVQEVRNIIKDKGFSNEVSNYIEKTFLFMFNNYDSKRFNNLSKDSYLKLYLTILQKLKKVEMIATEDLKRKDMKEFRDSAIDVYGNFITFKEENGEYIAMQDVYSCLCSGIVSRENNVIYLWKEMGIEDTIRTFHHEMGHINQGLNAYYISANMPLAFFIHVMLEEGEVVFKEQALGSYKDYDIEVIDDVSDTLTFETGVAYPFYGVVYQLLGLILSFEVLESLGKSNQRIDSFEILKNSFSDDLIKTIYLHLVNIINIYNLNYPETSEYNKHFLEASILKCENERKRELSDVLRNIFTASGNLNGVSLMIPNNELFTLLKKKEKLQDMSILEDLRSMQERGVSMLNSLNVLEALARKQISMRPQEMQECQLQFLEGVLACVSVKSRKV